MFERPAALGAWVIFLAACAPIAAPPTLPPAATPPPAATAAPTAAQATAPPTTGAVGFLEGHVTIGPLQPVQRVGAPTPIAPPEVYAARSINVFQADGATLVVNAKFNSDGTYRIALAPGVYVVALARSGIDRAAGLPKTITIESGKTVRLDIDIDTGIR